MLIAHIEYNGGETLGRNPQIWRWKMGFTIEDMLVVSQDRYKMKMVAGSRGWSNSISWLLVMEELTIIHNFSGNPCIGAVAELRFSPVQTFTVQCILYILPDNLQTEGLRKGCHSLNF